MIELDIPAAMWLSSNARHHRMVVANRTRDVRTLARLAARNHPPMPGPVIATVAVAYPTARRADPPNAWPTIKAAIDGLVDAGVLIDDNSTVVDEHRFRRDHNPARRGMYRLTITLTPIEPLTKEGLHA